MLGRAFRSQDAVQGRGGVAGYRIVPIFADAQSKVDVAINEMTRLILSLIHI